MYICCCLFVTVLPFCVNCHLMIDWMDTGFVVVLVNGRSYNDSKYKKATLTGFQACKLSCCCYYWYYYYCCCCRCRCSCCCCRCLCRCHNCYCTQVTTLLLNNQQSTLTRNYQTNMLLSIVYKVTLHFVI